MSFIHSIIFKLDELTSFPLTLESTKVYVYNNTTFHTVGFTSSTVSETPNGTISLPIDCILISLIKMFSGVDILLIFIYTFFLSIVKERKTLTTQRTRHHILLETIQSMKILRLICLSNNLSRRSNCVIFC
mgnify:CR=1 FL=1